MLSEENPHQLYQPIRMQGQQYDEESGLHYNRHRYYDPTIGRYITQDPIGLRGGFNFYGYLLDPMAYIDPLGLACVSGTHAVSSNPADTKKLQDALQSYLNKGITYGTGANQLVCNQLVDRSINNSISKYRAGRAKYSSNACQHWAIFKNEHTKTWRLSTYDRPRSRSSSYRRK
nr:RHS repeat-associated core domain-containing protein [Hafnia alvei]